MRILTGIDLPFAPSCGSVILCDDVYSKLEPHHNARFLSLLSEASFASCRMSDVWGLPVRKETETKRYAQYVDRLGDHVRHHYEVFRPDILHVQHLTYGMANAICGLPDTVPTIAVCHGTDILSALDDAVHRRDVQAVLDRADRVVFPTRQMLEDAKAISHVPDAKSVVFPWGISDDHFFGELATYDESAVRMVYAGRLVHGKGVDVLIRALEYLGGRFSLDIIGQGPEREALENLALGVGLERRVRFIPWMPRRQLRQVFARYQIAAVPSRIVEAFGLVALEAQSAGLPVVHSRTGGLPEVVGDAELSFASEDVHGLADVILKLTSSAAQWQRRSRKSLENALRFPISRTRRRLLDLSEQLVARRCRSSAHTWVRSIEESNEAALGQRLPGIVEQATIEIVAPPSVNYTAQWYQDYDNVTGTDLDAKVMEMMAAERIVMRREPNSAAKLRPRAFLDVGTCTGRYLHWAIRMDFEVVMGLDVAEAAVWHCQRNLPQWVAVLLADILGEESRPSAFGCGFDLITMMFGTLNHFTSGQRQAAISKLGRALSPEGALLISSWLPSKCAFSLYGADEIATIDAQAMDLSELELLAASSGLGIRKAEHTPYHVVAELRRLDDC